MYYFAYGSNMNHQQMHERCPGSKFIRRVILKGYKFVYDGHSKNRAGAVANIIKSKSSRVLGGLYEISKEDFTNLDVYEGFPDNYDRMVVEIQDEENTISNVMVYFRKWKRRGKPSMLYRKIVTQGAKDCGLPDDYIMNNL